MNDMFMAADYGDDAGLGLADDVTPEKMADVMRLAQEQVRLTQWIEKADALLKERKKALHILSTVELPKAMLDARMRDFTLNDGARVKIEDLVVGDVKAADREDFCDWLEAEGRDSIVKKVVAVAFGKGEQALAAELLDWLQERYPNRKVENNRTIHPQTLQKFIRECHAKGDPLPEMVRVTELQQAVISLADKEDIL